MSETLVVVTTITCIVLVAAYIVGMFLMCWRMQDMGKRIAALEKKLESANGRITRQEAGLKELSSRKQDRSAIELADMVRLASDWRSRGLWPTLAGLGFRAFRVVPMLRANSSDDGKIALEER